MSWRKVMCAVTAAGALGLAGCAMDPYYTTHPSDPAYPGYPSREVARYGYVESIDTVTAERRDGPGLGAIGGAVVGGIVGNQVGRGSGNTAATIGGAVLGGIVGHQVERHVRGRYPQQDVVYDFRIRMDDGSYRTIRKETPDGIRIGDRVRVEGDNLFVM